MSFVVLEEYVLVLLVLRAFLMVRMVSFRCLSLFRRSVTLLTFDRWLTLIFLRLFVVVLDEFGMLLLFMRMLLYSLACGSCEDGFIRLFGV